MSRFSRISSFSLISCLFRFLMLISNLGIKCRLLPLPRALDGALNTIIQSELPFLDVEAIVAEIVSIAVLIQVSSKFWRLSASFRVSLTLLLIWRGFLFFVHCIDTEESVDLDSVSNFEDRDESEELFSFWAS